MPKKIITVGYLVPHDEVEYLELTSKRSLLEADIILFSPSIDLWTGQDIEFDGTCLLSAAKSKIWSEAIQHWKIEIDHAVDSGKLVIIMLSQPIKALTQGAIKKYTGSGKNRVVESFGAKLCSYEAIPRDCNYQIAQGTQMSIDSEARIFAPLWSEFSQFASYNVYFKQPVEKPHTMLPLLRTKDGDRIVGIYEIKEKGALVLFPYINFDNDETKEVWSKQDLQLGHQFISALTSLDNSIKAGCTKTPTPDWVKLDDYKFSKEKLLIKKIEQIENNISKLEIEKSKAIEELEATCKLRDLLYEQGTALEASIIDALKLFKFQADSHDDGMNEFDAIFFCDEGRCLGEAEGKDNKEINIAKFSQLERKLSEDFEIEDVDKHAKGVMFGNPHRLAEPSKRVKLFTAKCISAAKRIDAALVHTPDLFEPARYLKEIDDPKFAKLCRDAILNTKGDIVKFPKVPSKSHTVKKNGGAI